MSPSPIVVRDLAVAFAGTRVLNRIDLLASPGQRVALVGENGVGKSTLLRAVAGELPRTAQLTGVVDRPADLVWLPQEPPFRDSDSVADVLMRALRPLRDAVASVERLAERIDDPEGARQHAEILDWAVVHDAWGAGRRALLAAEQLGVARLRPERAVGSLSGGQRTRLALATAIVRRPDALVMDEPTNHLDDDAVERLVDFLRELPGTVLVASHDRAFLDEVATTLVDLDPLPVGSGGTDGQGGRTFGGGWTAY